jgi:glycosyltransferase involved in cell wall biosynthesis
MAVLRPCPATPGLQHTVGRSLLPRVLYVVNMNPTDKFGSLEEQIVFLSRAFEEQGSRLVPLFTWTGAQDLTHLQHLRGLESYSLDLTRFRWRSLVDLWTLLGRLGITVIHWNMTDPLVNAYLWLLALVRPDIRHFYSDHNSRENEPHAPPTGIKRAIKRLLLKCYRQVWCVSDFVRRCLVAQGTWSNLRRCLHFVNTDRFQPDAGARLRLREQQGVDKCFVILLITQLIKAKGVDLALVALAELPEQAIVWIVGTGPLAEELLALARKLGIEHRVRFWGLQRQVEPFLQAADCLVLPSRWQEAAGLVLLEAQAAGLPVVASRIGGIPEYVAEDRSALLFKPDDAGDLATQLRKLHDDAALRDCLGRTGRELILERFSVASRLPEWLDLYRHR